MPSDDYTTAIRGSLKLKGGPSKPEGVKKKKKKVKPPTDEALQKALDDADQDGGSSSKEVVKGKKKDKESEKEDEELDEAQLRELDPRGGDGKTASERAYEEVRRKRVCLFPLKVPLAVYSFFKTKSRSKNPEANKTKTTVTRAYPKGRTKNT